MSKKLKSLDICFENCEVFTIPPECIHWFQFTGFKRTMFFQSPNDVFEHDSAEFVKLQLIHLNRISQSDFGYDFESRIKMYNDITQITLNYDDDTYFNFCVPWGGDSDYTNKYQYVKIDKDEYVNEEVMYIMFSKDKPEDWDESEEVE
jgi:hypothetical protein